MDSSMWAVSGSKFIAVWGLELFRLEETLSLSFSLRLSAGVWRTLACDRRGGYDLGYLRRSVVTLQKTFWLWFSCGNFLLGSAWPAEEEERSLRLPECRQTLEVCADQIHVLMVCFKFGFVWCTPTYRASALPLLSFPPPLCSSQCWRRGDGRGWRLLHCMGL